MQTKQQPSRAQRSTRKRSRAQRDEDEDVSFVALPRDELLKISSRHLEDRTKELGKTRPLTTAELREVKRQRRLVKNREYAQASRVKKKAHVVDLRQQVDAIATENQELQSKVTTLSARVTQLEAENERLRMKLQMANIPVEPTEQEEAYVNSLVNVDSIEKPSALSSFSLKTGTVCLFVVMFCFAIIFNPVQRLGPLSRESVQGTETLDSQFSTHRRMFEKSEPSFQNDVPWDLSEPLMIRSLLGEPDGSICGLSDDTSICHAPMQNECNITISLLSNLTFCK